MVEVLDRFLRCLTIFHLCFLSLKVQESFVGRFSVPSLKGPSRKNYRLVYLVIVLLIIWIDSLQEKMPLKKIFFKNIYLTTTFFSRQCFYWLVLEKTKKKHLNLLTKSFLNSVADTATQCKDFRRTSPVQDCTLYLIYLF